MSSELEWGQNDRRDDASRTSDAPQERPEFLPPTDAPGFVGPGQSSYGPAAPQSQYPSGFDPAGESAYGPGFDSAGQSSYGSTASQSPHGPGFDSAGQSSYGSAASQSPYPSGFGALAAPQPAGRGGPGSVGQPGAWPTDGYAYPPADAAPAGWQPQASVVGPYGAGQVPAEDPATRRGRLRQSAPGGGLAVMTIVAEAIAAVCGLLLLTNGASVLVMLVRVPEALSFMVPDLTLIGWLLVAGGVLGASAAVAAIIFSATRSRHLWIAAAVGVLGGLCGIGANVKMAMLVSLILDMAGSSAPESAVAPLRAVTVYLWALAILVLLAHIVAAVYGLRLRRHYLAGGAPPQPVPGAYASGAWGQPDQQYGGSFPPTAGGYGYEAPGYGTADMSATGAPGYGAPTQTSATGGPDYGASAGSDADPTYGQQPRPY